MVRKAPITSRIDDALKAALDAQEKLYVLELTADDAVLFAQQLGVPAAPKRYGGVRLEIRSGPAPSLLLSKGRAPTFVERKI